MKSELAIKLLLAIIGTVCIFHVCIFIGIIPYEVTWGGKLESDSEMYVFETLSIAINIFLAVILLIKGKYIKQILPPKAVRLILWLFIALFGLNTIGNLFAETYFEKSMSALTLTLSILLWFALGRNDAKSRLKKQ